MIWLRRNPQEPADALRWMLGLISLILIVATPAFAQQTEFGVAADPDAEVRMTAEQLVVDETAGTAEMIGDVVISQGELMLSAPRVFVIYDQEKGAIDRMEARGGVLIVSGEDAAEGNEADYLVADGAISLRGDVLLKQGDGATIASQALRIDIETGRAVAAGRVRGILPRTAPQ